MIGDEDIFEIPPYPSEWDSEQRVAAYWHALYHTNLPANTEGWRLVWRSLERQSAGKAARHLTAVPPSDRPKKSVKERP